MVPTTIPIHQLTLETSTLHFNLNIINIQHDKNFLPFHFFGGLYEELASLTPFFAIFPLATIKTKQKNLS
jgi:hypothetical protein